MVRVPGTWLSAGLGLVLVVVGVVVLGLPAAQAEVGWFSYGGPPSAKVLEDVVAWNPVRAVGAALVLLGLLVLAHLLGALAARRGATELVRLGRASLVLALVLVVGGSAGFLVLRTFGRRTATVSFTSSAWTRQEAAAALVVATGLVLGAVGTGLRSRTKASA